MPYSVKKLPNGQYATITKATGKIHGRHPSKEKAIAQIAAIEENSKEGKK